MCYRNIIQKKLWYLLHSTETAVHIVFAPWVSLISAVVPYTSFYSYLSGLHPWHWCNLTSAAVPFNPSINSPPPPPWTRHFADDVIKCIFWNENALISIKNSLKFIPNGQISNILVLVQIMAWRRPGDKPLSELMLTLVETLWDIV